MNDSGAGAPRELGGAVHTFVVDNKDLDGRIGDGLEVLFSGGEMVRVSGI